MATVCVIGSGARELALVRALKRSSKCGAVRCFGAEPNPGIAELAGSVEVGDDTSPDAVLAFCKGGKADIVIAGGAASKSGVVDVLLGGGIRVVGARKAAAAVADVDFARDLMKQVRAPRAALPPHIVLLLACALVRAPALAFATSRLRLPLPHAIRPLAPHVRRRRAFVCVRACARRVSPTYSLRFTHASPREAAARLFAPAARANSSASCPSVMAQRACTCHRCSPSRQLFSRVSSLEALDGKIFWGTDF